MMRILLIAFVTLAAVTTALCDELVTLGGRTFYNVKVTGKDALGVSITHNRGVTRVLFSEMAIPDQEKYGYEPAKAQEYLREQARIEDAAKQAVKAIEKQKQDALEKQQRFEEQRLAIAQRMAQEEIERKEQARCDRFKPSGMSVAAFHAIRPITPTVFLANAQLSDYFNYEFSNLSSPGVEDLFWSIRIETPEGEDIGHGYIRKEDRGSALFTMLSDGDWHPIIARLKYTSHAEDSSVFILLDYKETE